MEIDPKRTVVLTLDVQNDLVAITPKIEENRILENIAAVVGAARKSDVPVIHITASVRADFRDIPRDNPLWDGIREAGAMIYGTPGAQIHPAVAPLDSELVINKTCVDPFLTTNLGQALVNADANTIVITGLWTNYVVEATARHASDMGYRVYIVADACASNTQENHDFTIQKILPTICYVTDTETAVGALG